jgi:uridine phosphorylase
MQTSVDTVVAVHQNSRLTCGCAGPAPFVVLIAEELFATGCQLLVSVTSAGQITPVEQTPYFVIIDRALRDEGTSYHYAAPSEYGHADPGLVAIAVDALKSKGLPAVVGSSWTTDAPFRETAEAIEAARSKGVLAMEMEAAALYTFAQVAQVAHVQVLCRSRHEYDGTNRTGFRERRSGRHRGCPTNYRSNRAGEVSRSQFFQRFLMGHDRQNSK